MLKIIKNKNTILGYKQLSVLFITLSSFLLLQSCDIEPIKEEKSKFRHSTSYVHLITSHEQGSTIKLIVDAKKEDQGSIWIDLNGNRKVDPGEIITSFGKPIEFKVAEAVTIHGKMTSFNCSGNDIERIDVRQGRELVDLDCSNNKLIELNVSKNTNLRRLKCDMNFLDGKQMSKLLKTLRTIPSKEDKKAELIIMKKDDKGEKNRLSLGQIKIGKGKNWKLLYENGEEIEEDNKLSHISFKVDKTKLGDKIRLQIDANEEEQDGIWIDLNNNGLMDEGERIEKFGEDNEHLAEYSIANSTDGEIIIYGAIRRLVAKNQQILSIVISNCPTLEWLDCQNCFVKEIDFSNNNMKHVDITNNDVTVLDLTNSKGLQNLHCSDNNIKILDLKNCEALNYLSASDNQLSSIELPATSDLMNVSLSNNKLKSIDISKNPDINDLHIRNNELSKIDLSNLKDLKTLTIGDNQLETLDLEKHTELNTLKCENNKLKTLDLSKQGKRLNLLWCSGNQISSLKLNPESELEIISCHSNEIKGEAMTQLVNSIWKSTISPQAKFYVVKSDGGKEKNKITKAQVKIMKEKNWKVFDGIATNSKWEEEEEGTKPYEGE